MSKLRYIDDEEIERLVTDLRAQGYNEGRIIDQLEHINQQRKKKEQNQPAHISTVMDGIMESLK